MAGVNPGGIPWSNIGIIWGYGFKDDIVGESCENCISLHPCQKIDIEYDKLNQIGHFIRLSTLRPVANDLLNDALRLDNELSALAATCSLRSVSNPVNMPVQFRYRLSTVNTGNTDNSIAVIEWVLIQKCFASTGMVPFCQYSFYSGSLPKVWYRLAVHNWYQNVTGKEL